MGRFINPFTDYGFKFLFGREVEKELLIDFLNDLLSGEHVITDIQNGGLSTISTVWLTQVNG